LAARRHVGRLLDDVAGDSPDRTDVWEVSNGDLALAPRGADDLGCHGTRHQQVEMGAFAVVAFDHDQVGERAWLTCPEATYQPRRLVACLSDAVVVAETQNGVAIETVARRVAAHLGKDAGHVRGSPRS